jgi:membrane-associated phospholipid phosphatase
LRAPLREWRAADACCALLLAVLAFLVLLFPARVPHAGWVAGANAAGIVVTGVFRWLQRRSRGPLPRFLFGSFPIVLVAALWSEIPLVQGLWHARWFDGAVMDFEQRLFGVNVSLWCERFVSVPVTEWMMLGYFAYLPLVPILAAILFYRAGERAFDEYLLGLGLGYGICYLSFIAFPVAGPRYALASCYTRELSGPVFRRLTHLMETYGHFPGGSLPSPHATAGTIMLLLAYRYHRRTFYVILPVILTFYLATVYGRYHYVSDTVSGILLGALIVAITSRMTRGSAGPAEDVETHAPDTA